jgi:hypothetical protein
MDTSTSTRPANPTPLTWPPATQDERDRVRDQAITQAGALRAQAIADFWRDADAWIIDTVAYSRRSADRLAARLRQHAKQRAAAR